MVSEILDQDQVGVCGYSRTYRVPFVCEPSCWRREVKVGPTILSHIELEQVHKVGHIMVLGFVMDIWIILSIQPCMHIAYQPYAPISINLLEVSQVQVMSVACVLFCVDWTSKLQGLIQILLFELSGYLHCYYYYYSQIMIGFLFNWY